MTTAAEGRAGRSWRERLTAPVDIASLVFLRVAFGLLMCVTAVAFVALGEVQRELVEPDFHFKYWGFGWVSPWPGQGPTIHVLALAALSLLVALGALYRVTMPLLWLGFAHLFLSEQAIYENHYYLILLVGFLLMLAPAHRAFSVDAWRRPAIRSDVAPAWALWSLRAQIGLAYGFGGVAKLEPDWLRGEPLRMWLSERAGRPVIGALVSQEWAPYFFSYGGLVFDLAVVPLLLWRRTRVAAFVVAVWFHGMNAWLWDIGIFPWFMIAGTTLFFEPDWPRRWARRCSREAVRAAPAGASPSPPRRAPVLAVLAVFFAVQVLAPFRYLLYPGHVLWTEEGLRFSWRMKLRSKKGRVRFHLSDPASGREWTVKPEEILTGRQIRRFQAEPDMILQVAHELAARERRAGRERIEVRATSLVSLNGRRPALMIDPDVDLARVPFSVRPASWILPLDVPLEDRAPGGAAGPD